MHTRLLPPVASVLIVVILLSCITQLGDARQTAGGKVVEDNIDYVEWQQGPAPVWLAPAQAKEQSLQKVIETLQRPVKFWCDKKPLDEALSLLEAQVDTKIKINETELGLVGIDKDVPVSYEGSGSLEEVLRTLLRNINSDEELTYLISTQGIWVTTRDRADAEPILRSYDLTYFLPDASHAEALLFQITMHVDPDSWLQAGGTSTITCFGSQMLISAPWSTHARIETFLALIAKQDRKHLKALKLKSEPKDVIEAKEAAADPKPR